MTKDQNVTAGWGHLSLASTTAAAGTAAVRLPLYDGATGELEYWEAKLVLKSAPEVTGGTPTWELVSFFKEAAQETARATATRQVVGCRARAHLSGRTLTARCRPTPALSRALRRGSVRLTTRWQVRVPNTRAVRTIATVRQVARNRPGTGRVTG